MRQKVYLAIGSLLVAIVCSAQATTSSAAKPGVDRCGVSLSSLVPADSLLANQNLTCKPSVAYFAGPMLADPTCVGDVLRYLLADLHLLG